MAPAATRRAGVRDGTAHLQAPRDMKPEAVSASWHSGQATCTSCHQLSALEVMHTPAAVYNALLEAEHFVFVPDARNRHSRAPLGDAAP